MAKVAVASTDGVTINEHFGSAQEFLVYEVFDGGDFKFSERRAAPEGQSGHGNHGTAHLSASALEGVEAVLVSQIGPNATRILKGKGIKVYTLSMPIEKALQTYGRKLKLIQNMAENPAHEPSGSCDGGCCGKDGE